MKNFMESASFILSDDEDRFLAEDLSSSVDEKPDAKSGINLDSVTLNAKEQIFIFDLSVETDGLKAEKIAYEMIEKGCAKGNCLLALNGFRVYKIIDTIKTDKNGMVEVRLVDQLNEPDGDNNKMNVNLSTIKTKYGKTPIQFLFARTIHEIQQN
jgi:hypothetical protein